MDPAWIAVIGTVSGVAVTAASATITGLVVARQQRALAEMQLAATTGDSRRQEIRQAFLDYLAAFSALRDQIIALSERRAADPTTVGQVMEVCAPVESTQFKRAHHTLQIMGNAATSEAAFALTLQLWDLAELARTADSVAFYRGLEASRPLSMHLYAAMRAELAGAA